MSRRSPYKLADELRVNPNTCGRDGQIPYEYGYAWTWKPLNPQRKICGLKNIRIHLDGALATVWTGLYLSSSWLSVSKGMICYSHSLFLVCSHVKGDFLAGKKYHLKLEVSLFERILLIFINCYKSVF